MKVDNNEKARNMNTEAIKTSAKLPRVSATLPPFLPIIAEAIAAGTKTKPIFEGVNPFTADRNCGVMNVMLKLIAVVIKARSNPIEKFLFLNRIGLIKGSLAFLIRKMKKANVANPPRNNSTCICVIASKKNATDTANRPPPRISIRPAFPFALSKYFLKKGSVRSGSNERTNMSLQLPKLVINPAATGPKAFPSAKPTAEVPSARPLSLAQSI